MRTAVVGAGVMGTGITHAFLVAGLHVHLVDLSGERLAACVAKVRALFDGGVERGKLTSEQADEHAGRLTPTESVADLPEGLDVAIESVPERVEVKHDTLRRLSARRPRLLASNTGALPIGLLAEAVSDPSSFLGMHFFNPVWASRLVEIVRGEQTSDRARTQALDLVAHIGKTAIVVADVPGFATSRLGIALGLEAMRMVEEGVASAEDIDRAMQLGYKHPVGPLMLTDIVGLDVRLDVARNLATAHGPRFEPPQILRALVAAGSLGQKTGRGFYEWRDDLARPVAS